MTLNWKAGVGALAVLLGLAGCSSVQSVDVSTANDLRKQEDVLLIDVREPNEYAAGHIPGSKLIPLGQLESRLAEIPKDKQVIAVCRTGRRSGEATQLLAEKGYDVQNMTGGITAWKAAGYELQQ